MHVWDDIAGGTKDTLVPAHVTTALLAACWEDAEEVVDAFCGEDDGDLDGGACIDNDGRSSDSAAAPHRALASALRTLLELTGAQEVATILLACAASPDAHVDVLVDRALPPCDSWLAGLRRLRVLALVTVCRQQVAQCPPSCRHRERSVCWAVRALILCLTHAMLVPDAPSPVTDACVSGSACASAVQAHVTAVCAQQKCAACAVARPVSVRVPFCASDWLRLGSCVGTLLATTRHRVTSQECATVGGAAEDQWIVKAASARWRAVAVSSV
jgi:hypothetical protein